MSIEYIVLFYHGKKDIPKITRGLQEENIRGRKFLIFSTAPENSNDLLIKELEGSVDFDNIKWENTQLNKGYARLIGIREYDQSRLFNRFCREIGFVNRESFENNRTICVFIGNANPTEAYMVSYYQPMFGYSVYTNNPTESFMPRHPEPILLNATHMKMLDFFVDAERAMSVADMMFYKVLGDISKNQYNNVKNDLLKDGMIREGQSSGKGPKYGTTYYVISDKGRYEYFLNGGKKGLAPEDLFSQ